MTSKRLGALLAALLLVLLARPAWAQSGGPGNSGTGQDPAFEQAIYDRLAAINPAAVPIFKSATEAVGQDDAAAQAGFEQVLKLAPDFPDALRRLSYALIDLKQYDAAVTAARRAVSVDEGGYNNSALAQALLARDTPADRVEALKQARIAVQKLPRDTDVLFTLGRAGVANDDLDTLHQADNALLAVQPDRFEAHILHGIWLTADSDWEQSEQEFLLARRLGAPAAYIDKVLASGVSSRANSARWTRRSLYGLGVWVLGFLGLFLGGSVLSRMTLAAVNRTAPFGQYHLSGAESVLRQVYRAVIGLTALYFYLSIPLVFLITIGLGLLLAYLFAFVGQIPLSIMLAAGLAIIFTLIALVRSLFLRSREFDPGRPLQRSEAIELWQLTESIAARLETRPVTAIYITPWVEVAVTERGRIVSKLSERAERSLILGLGALPGMTRGQLRAILAHEYGHFSNHDTAGGNLARRVRASTFQLARNLAQNGLAHWYNPAWLFVNTFHRVFLRITLGASRLQEILADRYAVMAYGVRDFSEGLSHIVRQSVLFNKTVNREYEAATTQNRRLQNLYVLPELAELDRTGDVEKKFVELMNRPTAAYDSHPSLKERLRLVSQVGAPLAVGEDNRPAWELLGNAATLQQEMTTVVQNRVRR